MPESDLDRQDLETLKAVAHEAGELALDYFERSDVRFWDKSKGHPVTEADLAVNNLIRERLMAARPDYGWLSEETALSNETRTANRVWIVDPIDGTRAFMRQEPYWCIGLGLLEAGRPRAAAVYAPVLKERFTAIKDGGAFLNGDPIHVTDCGQEEGCRLITNEGMLPHPGWQEPWPEVELARPKPNATLLRMCWVAAGKFDAALTLWRKSDWDLAAGCGSRRRVASRQPTSVNLMCLIAGNLHKEAFWRLERHCIPCYQRESKAYACQIRTGPCVRMNELSRRSARTWARQIQSNCFTS